MAPPETSLVQPELLYITPAEITAKIQQGHAIILYKNKVYDLTKWIDHHPGGTLAIQHMIGTDASDEIKAQHPDWVITKKMPHFYIGELALMPPSWQDHEPDGNDTAPIKADDSGIIRSLEQQKISAAWRLLDMKLHDEGFYETDNGYYYALAARLLFFFVSAWVLVIYFHDNTLAVVTSAIFMASLWHQGAFMAHDAGHNGISHQLQIDSKIGLTLGNCIGGISIGWWKSTHNVHHIVTNHPEHDPDIQHLPVFALSTRFFGDVYSTYHKKIMVFDALASCLVRIQHYLYYPVMCVARANLYIQSFIFLATAKRLPNRNMEIVGLVIFWTWYSTLLSFLPTWNMVAVYVAISHMLSGMLHLQITLSHFGMSTEDLGKGESFPAKMLRTTLDVDCPEWMDWFHGGLQFQTIHHLFPRIPRHNLRKVQPYVKQFCKDHGLTYHLHNFTRGNGIVLGAMKEIANQVDFILSTSQPPTDLHDARAKTG